MTTRLKRKLGDLGVDLNSRKATENFCLVSPRRLECQHWLSFALDWNTSPASREIERYWRICSLVEARGV